MLEVWGDSCRFSFLGIGPFGSHSIHVRWSRQASLLSIDERGSEKARALPEATCLEGKEFLENPGLLTGHIKVQLLCQPHTAAFLVCPLQEIPLLLHIKSST